MTKASSDKHSPFQDHHQILPWLQSMNRKGRQSPSTPKESVVGVKFTTQSVLGKRNVGKESKEVDFFSSA